MTRAVLVSPHPGQGGGGIERFCSLLGSVLAGLGIDVTEVGPDQSAATPWTRRLGLTYERARQEAARAVENAAPDLVISNGHLGGRFSVPHIHVFHGTLAPHAWSQRRAAPMRFVVQQGVGGTLAERRAGADADMRVAVSPSAAEEVHRFLRQGVDAVVPNGIDADLFSPGPRTAARERLGLSNSAKLAVFVGRPEPRKGADLLSAAAMAGHQLVVAGPSHPQADVNLGLLSGDDLVAAYRAADVVLFPTRYEACSYVVLEALAVATPLVTTDVGWMREIQKENPDYPVVNVGSPEAAFASAIAGWSALSETRRLELSKGARSTVLSHASTVQFEANWTRLVENLLGRRKGSDRG